MKKKIFSYTAAIILLASCLCGCASEDSSPQTPPADTDDPVSAPSLTVVSSIYGWADTGNKSTLKVTLQKTSGPGDQEIYYYNEEGKRTAYEEGTVIQLPPVVYTGEAVFDLGEGLDDSLIDSSGAVVRIAEGDGYYPDELELHASALEGEWKDGKYHYTLQPGDITWFTGDYPLKDPNSSREWSCFGGDGNGCYTFRFEVSDILYDGQEIAPETFPVQVYIWGRDATDRAAQFDEVPDPAASQAESGKRPAGEVQWTWKGAGEKPILCDGLADDFFITWPEGTDAGGVTSGDVTVTLFNDYGGSFVLTDDLCQVFAGPEETQIAVTYMQWSYTPVFTSMSIEVKSGELSAANTYDVSSIYVYLVQQGGGGVPVDGTVTAYSFYGLENLADAGQVMNNASYILVTGEGDEARYYAESAEGLGYLTPDAEKAARYNASGESECNQRLIVNTAWITTRMGQTEAKTVDGESIEFRKEYQTFVVKEAPELAEAGLTASRGYVLGDTLNHEMWSWQKRFLAGYTPDKPATTQFPYTTFPFGF